MNAILKGLQKWRTENRSNTWTFGAPKINGHGNIFLNDNS